ncbi:UNVERIFIED_ORG: autotransporter adhesin [Stenotrophomonas geniculata]
MNRIFRKVWSKALGRLVVASELASRQSAASAAGGAAVARSGHHSAVAGVALVAALLGPPLDALAGNGIHINANPDGNCVSLSDPQVGYATGSADAIFQLQLRDNLRFSDGAVECNSANKASQTGSVLFYRPAGVNGTGATSLTLGGELHVNGTLHLNSGIVNAKRLVVGPSASAIGATDWALGEGAQASGDKPDPENTSAEYGFALAFGNNAKALHTYATAVGPASEARGARSTALGASSIASGYSSLAMGRFAQASGHSSTALGRSTIARAKDSLVMGYGAQTAAGAEKAVALGASAIARGTDSLAIGSGAQTAEVNNAIALGVGARGNAADAVAIGVGAVSDVFGSVALGTNAKTTAHRAVGAMTLNGTTYNFLPQGLSAPNVNGVVSMGSAASSRQIINVAPGVIDATSYDAVNGSQLFAAFNEIGKLGEKEKALVARDVAQQVQIDALLARPTGSSVDVASIAQAMGVPVNPNGTLQMPIMDLKSLGEGVQQPQNLVDGIKALDAQLARNDAALGTVLDGLMQNAEGTAENAVGVQANTAALAALQDKLEKGELGLVQQDAGTRTLTVGKDADGGRVDVSGKDGARTVAGLKDARLSADSTEAVTGAQLKTANDALADTDARVASNRDDIAKVAEDVARNATELVDAKAAADTAQATATTALATAGTAQTAADVARAAAGAVSTRLDGLAADSLLWNKDIGAFDARHGEQATSRIGNVAAGVGTTDAVNVGQLRAVGEVADAAKDTAEMAQSAATAAASDAGAAKSAADAAQATAAAAAQKADAAGAKADTATTAAATAGQKADTALTNATTAGATANEAKALAEAADRKADTAGTKADAATSAAATAGGKADSASAAAAAAGEKADAAGTKADAATAAATAAGQKADTALTNAATAGATANEAKALAEAADRKADAAGTKADTATSAAATAGQKADSAVTAAATAGEKADSAIAAAAAAGIKADTAATAAATAGQKADSATTAATTAGEKADTAGIRADSATTAAATAGQKADSATAAAAVAGDKADAAGIKADAATTAAAAAGQKADTATAAANTAGEKADSATTAAATAGEKADAAGIKADAATAAAASAGHKVDSAVTAAVAAGEKADTAVTSAATANTVANEATSLANTAGTTATAAQASANQANAAAAVLEGRADATDESLSRLRNGTAGLVQQDQATREIKVGAGSDGTRIQVGGSEGPRTITGLRDGRIAADSTEAVTGAQANALAQRLDRLDTRGNGIHVDGAETAGNAARAAAGSGALAIGAQAVAEHRNSVALGANARTNRADSVSVGSAGAERQITHVAPATQDTDAVNLRQTRSISQRAASQAVAQANAYTDNQMQRLRRETKAGIAVAMAAAGLPLNGAPGARSAAIAGATYGGESALALGLQKVSEDGGFIFKASGSMSADGDSGASVGVGFSW